MGTGFVFGSLLYTCTDRLIVIRRTDRKELPHLTISFKNASGEIDGHLKDESALVGTNPYSSRFQISKAMLSQFEEDASGLFGREFLNIYSNVKRVRPGWLNRKGYVLGLTESEALRSAILEAAPKRKGKHRLDLEKIKKVFKVFAEDPSRISLLDPSVLHSNELWNRFDPIFAGRAWGRNRLICLAHASWKSGNRSWILVNPVAKAMPDLLEMIVPTETKQKIKSIWYKIHDALQLHGLGIARD